jgi:thioredoxin reductase
VKQLLFLQELRLNIWISIQPHQNGGVSASVQFAMVFYRNQEVVIVGAGDSACEEAHIFLNYVKK